MDQLDQKKTEAIAAWTLRSSWGDIPDPSQFKDPDVKAMLTRLEYHKREFDRADDELRALAHKLGYESL